MRNFKLNHVGLNAEDVAQRLKTYGYNSEIKRTDSRKLKFYGVFKNLRLYLMLGAAFLYLIGGIGGGVTTGALLILLSVGFCVFEIFMENHCDKKLFSVVNKSEITVRAVRDGEIVLVESRKLVQDDLIVLQGGENVPADAHILEA
jgi:Ca2+-transporting ATPase